MVLTPTAASGYSICHSGTNCAWYGQRALSFTISYFFTNIYWGIPGDPAVKSQPEMKAGDAGATPGEGNGSPLQFLPEEKPWREETGGLQSMGSQRVRHNGSN